MQNVEARIRVQGLINVKDNSFVYAYIFSPYNSLNSKYIRLNGDLLMANKDVEPRFKPMLINPYPYLIMPPFSSVFWIFPTDKIKICSNLNYK